MMPHAALHLQFEQLSHLLRGFVQPFAEFIIGFSRERLVEEIFQVLLALVESNIVLW